MKKFTGIVYFFCLVGFFTSDAIELYDLNDITLKLDLEYTQSLSYDITEVAAAWQAPEVEIGMEGIKDKLALTFSLDLSQIYQEDYQDILKNCFFSLVFPGDYKLKVGQFKNPFGQENNKGQASRPYPGHAVTSDAIAPGYSRGIAVSGKPIVDFLEFAAGIFVDGKISKAENDLFKFRTAGRLMLQFAPSDLIKLEGAYSGLANLDFTSVLQYDLAQGFALQMDLNLGKKNDLSLFAEFLENYARTFFLNADPQWTHGIFTSISWRLADWEPYAVYEHFLGNAAVPSGEDTMVVSGGINYYPVDDLEFCLYYRWDYLYLTLESSHKASLVMHYGL